MQPLHRPIKVLHVVLSLAPGGLENGLVNVACGLDPEAFQTDICCLQERGEFADRLPVQSKVYVLNKPEGFSLAAVRGLAGVIETVRPGIIHTHNLGNLIYGSLATMLGKRYSILHSEHGELTADELSRKRLLQRRCFYRCSRVIHTVSDELRRQLIALGFDEAKIHAVRNGVDEQRYSPGDSLRYRRQLGLSESGPVLGIVGRFIPSKRHDLLLRAFEEFSQEEPQAQLLIVGACGSEYERVVHLSRTSPCASRIHLAGFQANPCPYYQAMDLLVLPSLIEGMSNVVLEAMACAVPVLSHTSCGGAEILIDRENGFVRNIETVERLLMQLRTILSVPAERLADIRRNARATILRRFSLSNMIESYACLYRNTLQANRESPLQAEANRCGS